MAADAGTKRRVIVSCLGAAGTVRENFRLRQETAALRLSKIDFELIDERLKALLIPAAT
jgi:hypothetical protein